MAFSIGGGNNEYLKKNFQQMHVPYVGGFSPANPNIPTGDNQQSLVDKFDSWDARALTGSTGSEGAVKPVLTPAGNVENGQGKSTATGIQALIDKFNGWDSNAITGGSKTELAGINPFSETMPISPVAPAERVASGGNQDLQKALASLGTGELSPNVAGGNLRHLAWA